jgi:hypothetical protein
MAPIHVLKGTHNVRSLSLKDAHAMIFHSIHPDGLRGKVVGDELW